MAALTQINPVKDFQQATKAVGLNLQVTNYIKYLKDNGEDDIDIQKKANVLRGSIGLKQIPIKLSLTQQIRDWISITQGEFATRDVFEELNISRDQKQKVSIILTRLIAEGLIERTGKRTGYFRQIEKDLVKMNIFKSKRETVDIQLPFAINEMVNVMPGNVIVIAGSKDAGKTAFLLNIAKNNWDNFKIHYFNSEMGEDELDIRLGLFNHEPASDWGKVNFYERDENFHDLIIPGKGNINIIDFLEIYEDFWITKKYIAAIWRKLQGAIAIIALQKPRGRDTGIGGEGTLEKARLYLSMDKGNLTIVSAKNWKGKVNPNGVKIQFKIIQGCELREDY